MNTKSSKTKNTTFSFRISNVTKAKLEKEALLENRPASYIADMAINEYLEEKEIKRKYTEELTLEVKKGKYLSEDKFMKWFADYCGVKSK
jgi:predicted transcriptional regulator